MNQQSGNTGIGLSAVATALNLKIIITMPETMSVERRNLMKAYGAELVLTPGSEGMKGAIAKAKELASQIENSFIPGQFENPARSTAHYKTTGPEIYEQTERKSRYLCSRSRNRRNNFRDRKYLKEKNPEVKVVAVEPASSPVLSTGKGGAHKIQGIGAGFVPETLDTKIYDEIITVENEDAFATGKEMAKTEGILVGISSGAALYAAKELAKRRKCGEDNCRLITRWWRSLFINTFNSRLGKLFSLFLKGEYRDEKFSIQDTTRSIRFRGKNKRCKNTWY